MTLTIRCTWPLLGRIWSDGTTLTRKFLRTFLRWTKFGKTQTLSSWHCRMSLPGLGIIYTPVFKASSRRTLSSKRCLLWVLKLKTRWSSKSTPSNISEWWREELKRAWKRFWRVTNRQKKPKRRNICINQDITMLLPCFGGRMANF